MLAVDHNEAAAKCCHRLESTPGCQTLVVPVPSVMSERADSVLSTKVKQKVKIALFVVSLEVRQPEAAAASPSRLPFN